MKFVFDDGGRAAAGYKGITGDCVTRAIAIAAELPYAEVYQALAKGTGAQRASTRTRGRAASARNGINVRRKWFKEYMASIGFAWTPTMHIGSGCKVHLHDGELPAGRLVVSVSKHYTAVVDGVVRDIYDPQRETHCVQPGSNGSSDDPDARSWIERRCVYGYWAKTA